MKTGSGLIVRQDGEVSGREPRSLSLEGRTGASGADDRLCRFRYAVLDDPPRRSRSPGRARGEPPRSEGSPGRCSTRPRRSIELFGHHIQPGKTKVFKAALEIRPDERACRASIRVLKPADGSQPCHQIRGSRHPRPGRRPGQRLSILVRRQPGLFRLFRPVHPQDVLPSGVRPAQEHAGPEAGPDAVADPE